MWMRCWAGKKPENLLWIGPPFTLALHTPEEANQVIHHTARLHGYLCGRPSQMALLWCNAKRSTPVSCWTMWRGWMDRGVLAMSRSKDATVISKIFAQFNSQMQPFERRLGGSSPSSTSASKPSLQCLDDPLPMFDDPDTSRSTMTVKAVKSSCAPHQLRGRHEVELMASQGLRDSGR